MFIITYQRINCKDVVFSLKDNFIHWDEAVSVGTLGATEEETARDLRKVDALLFATEDEANEMKAEFEKVIERDDFPGGGEVINIAVEEVIEES